MSGVANLVAGMAIILVIQYAQAYFAKKGENLATKEDIAALTRTVEAIRSEYALLLQRSSQAHAMRMAALDRRLQAHQEAYAFWHRLFPNAHDGTACAPIVLECEEWWTRNCLYLDEASRKAFRASYRAAWGHARLIDMSRDSHDTAVVGASWEQIMAAGDILVQGAALPSLAAEEHEKVGKTVGASGTT